MCISDIDAYQYQYLKGKTHNNPPYQSVISIRTWWYSPSINGFAIYLNLMSYIKALIPLRLQYLLITKCQQ